MVSTSVILLFVLLGINQNQIILSQGRVHKCTQIFCVIFFRFGVTSSPAYQIKLFLTFSLVGCSSYSVTGSWVYGLMSGLI